MSSTWLDPSEVFIRQPKTPEEVDALAEDLEALVRLIPQSAEWIDSYMQTVRDYPHYLMLVYHNDQPVGFIQISDSDGYKYLGKHSLEFWGSIIPEYRDKGLTQMVAPEAIRRAFQRPGKNKMLADIQPDNHEARMAITALGFTHIGERPNRDLMYRLKKDEVRA